MMNFPETHLDSLRKKLHELHLEQYLSLEGGEALANKATDLIMGYVDCKDIKVNTLPLEDLDGFLSGNDRSAKVIAEWRREINL